METLKETLKGFTIFAGGIDIFIESDKTRRTTNLAKEIIRKLNGTGRFDIPDNASGIDAVLHYLRKATCKIEPLVDGRQMYVISGDGFSTCGIVGDKTTMIIRTKEEEK